MLLAALLFLMFCVCGFFVGFRWGDVMRGRQGREPPSPHYVRAYPVHELIMPGANGVQDIRLIQQKGPKLKKFAALCREVKRNVEPASWESQGGDASIAPFATNLTLVVSHTPEGHRAVADFLRKKRQSTQNSQAPTGKP